MNCPKCNHPIYEHSNGRFGAGCYHVSYTEMYPDGIEDCTCTLTQKEIKELIDKELEDNHES